MRPLSPGVVDWIRDAPTERLLEKLCEYSEDSGMLSPRDAEMRSRLRAEIRKQLVDRQVPQS